MGEIGDLEIAAQLDYSKTTLSQFHEYIYALRDKGGSDDRDGWKLIGHRRLSQVFPRIRGNNQIELIISF